MKLPGWKKLFRLWNEKDVPTNPRIDWEKAVVTLAAARKTLNAYANDRMALSFALRDALFCFNNALDTHVTEERVETWQKVLDDHGLFDYPQGVSR